ncbi:DUF3611 family protein [Crocosphaera sp.]|uniref:DUF3611 family protein n=1 Tax=Crocosphaera sp. TaxID=2729996 RepID=UPI003F240D6A|nr:DUF3611 family protein [Crocosphaera sp.]
MSQNYQISQPLPPNVKRAATILQWSGNIGFWGQLVLGVLAAALLFLALPGLAGQENRTEGTNFSIFCSIAGVSALLISILICFRYKKIAQSMRNPEAKARPKKSSTLQLIRAGLLSNLVGIFLSIIGAEGFVGLVWLKLSNIPQGASVYGTSSSNLLTPNDFLLLLANTHTILCHFVGIVVGLYLLDRLDR